MDKFGIFNLLSSFLGFASEKRATEKNESAADGRKNFRAEEEDFANRPNAAPDFPSRGEQNSAPNAAKKAARFSSSPPTSQNVSQNSARHTAPLTAGMLSVMRSHEEFVKRVRENNAKKNDQ